MYFKTLDHLSQIWQELINVLRIELVRNKLQCSFNQLKMLYHSNSEIKHF